MDTVPAGADCCFALCLYMGVSLSLSQSYLCRAVFGLFELFFFLFIHPVAEAVEQPMD